MSGSTSTRSGSTRVSAALLWVLLEALRAQDTPPDILPEENPHPRMPQRLGMSDVIFGQIRRYREMGYRGRVSLDDAADLFRLVARRADAAEVFDAAGRTLAARTFARRSASFRLMLKILPRRSRRRLALRHARRHVGGMIGTTRYRLADPPGAFHAEGALSTRVGSTAACRLYGAFFEESLRKFTGAAWRVEHETCEVMSNGRCVWTVVRPETPAA